MKYGVTEIAPGLAGTDQTVEVISKLVGNSLRRPVIRLKAISIINNARVGNHDQYSAAVALYNFVKSHIRYLPDPVDVETVQDPEITLQLKAGDCDDHVALLSALMMSVGINVRYRVVGYSQNNFFHIFPEFQHGGKWIAADTTSRFNLGQRPPQFPAEKVYNYTGDRIMPLGNLSQNRGQLSGYLPISMRTLEAVAYRATLKRLKANWNAGLINRRDVQSYIRVIDEGNSPGRGTFADPMMRQAMVNFIAEIDRTHAVSAKPLDKIGNLYGLDGFLSSVWNSVKSAVSGAVKTVTGAAGAVIGAVTGSGGQPTTVTVQVPEIKAPDISLIKTETPPESVEAGIASMFKNPVVLAGLGLMAYLAFIKR